jgi:HD superfamily phosphohydrolase
MRKKAEDYLKECSIDIIRSKQSEIESLRIQLSEEREKTLDSTIKMFRNRWESAMEFEKQNRRSSGFYFLDDPIHGQITIPDYANHLWDHPILRRLDFVKQLSYAYLQHKSATHSRLSHSIGVAGLMVKALQNIWTKGIIVTKSGPKQIEISTDEKLELLRIAFLVGLFHDIGHGPFGHALDRYIAYRNPNNLLPKPDKHMTIVYIEQYLKEPIEYAHLDYARIRKILDPKQRRTLDGWDSFIAELVDSALDVDRMDYLVRDSRMTGLTAGTVNISALMERMIAFEEDGQVRLVYHNTALPYIENFLYARDIMFISCYESASKLSAERILVKVVQKLVESKKIEVESLMLLTDEELMYVLFYKVPPSLGCDSLIASLKNARTFDLVISFPAAVSRLSDDGAKENKRNVEIRSWMASRLNEEWTKALIEKPLEWEHILARHAEISEDQVLITVPSDESFPDKQIDARILVTDDGVFRPQRITDFSRNISDLGEMLARNRQVIRIFVSPDLPPDRVAKVKEESMKLLGG